MKSKSKSKSKLTITNDQLPITNPIPLLLTKQATRTRRAEVRRRRITHHAPHAARATLHAPYSLRRGLGVWELTFAGDKAVLKHEQGILYVAHLLRHPHEPVHALELAARAAVSTDQHGGAMALDGVHGPLELQATIQQRSLALDDALAMRHVLRQQAQLEALLENDDEIDPVKEEAMRQLEILYEHEKRNSSKVRDTAAKASDAAATAIKRLCQRLAATVQADGSPCRVFRSFAEHLHR